jgi:hypothetical protein
LVSGLITERGICAASEEGILSLFAEYISKWWFELMIWIDDLNWWFELMIWTNF